MVPVLCDINQRIVLWGCQVEDRQITAELFYCDVHLPRILEISDRASKQAYRVEIPEILRNSMFAKKGQKLTLRLLANYQKGLIERK